MTENKSGERRQKRKEPKQINQVFKDPTNIFMVQNPETIPPLTDTSKNMLKQLLHSTNLIGFKLKSKNWVTNLSTDQVVDQMLVKIKQENPQNQTLPKFRIQVHPVFRKFSLNHFVSKKSVQFSGSVFNLTQDSFKHFTTYANWNYRLNQLSIWGQLKLWAPWLIQLGQKWGRPLDKKWVTDCRIFRLSYFLGKDSSRVGVINPYQFNSDMLYWETKGYQTRLRKSQLNKLGNYIDQSSLKKIDIIQVGYKHGKNLKSGTKQYGFKIGMGTDFNRVWYMKLIGNISRLYPLSNKYGILAFGQAGLIDGKNVIPHEMFSRNQTKWMGQRSKIFGHCRFDLIARGFQLLQAFRVVPSNYIGLWASRSNDNKFKLQAELGVSLQVLRTMFRLDFSLLRMGGVKGQPRFGLKYQF